MPGHTSYLQAVQAPTCICPPVHQSLCLSPKFQALQSVFCSDMVVVFISCCSASKPPLCVLLFCDAGVKVCKLCFSEAAARWLPILSVGRMAGRLEGGRKWKGFFCFQRWYHCRENSSKVQLRIQSPASLALPKPATLFLLKSTSTSQTHPP